ncbi:CLUMA_CG019232, isoform A [Clunio marinus]|uniref:CLUMA_CG019232, isoform A n=1 Tax=Clunio marinus TaxID=568069 RepID=A0A1J1J0Y0_9DIPT|nr:CLUMA_CG019232, isoform A [Clunio marinus]
MKAKAAVTAEAKQSPYALFLPSLFSFAFLTLKRSQTFFTSKSRGANDELSQKPTTTKGAEVLAKGKNEHVPWLEVSHLKTQILH